MFAQEAKPEVDKETIKTEQQAIKTKFPGAKVKTIRYDDGSVYVGECNKKMKEGVGTMFLSSGDIYRGEWVSDKMTGEGQMAYASGDNYSGMWKNGEKWGDGTITFSNGSKYTGQWENDVYCGHGIMTYETGEVYDGDWERGVKNGQGIMHFSNGDRCEGQWKDDVFINGFLKCKDRNGLTYEGELSQGKAINGIISFIGKEFSMKGEIKNGMPYITFTGVLPKDNPLFKTVYSSTGWDEISSGKTEGRLSGNSDIVGVFSKEIRKSKSSNERKVVDSGRGDFTNIVEHPYSIRQLTKLTVVGHLLSGHFTGDVSIVADFGSIHSTYYRDGSSSSTEIYSQTTSSSKWSDGKWISGSVQIAGKLDGKPFIDDFSIRTEGAKNNVFVVESDKYGVLDRSNDLLNSSEPSAIDEVITWLNTKVPRRISVKNSIDANNRAAAEISSVTKNKEQWRSNAVRLRDVRNSFNNSVATNKYLSNPFAIKVYVNGITECYDGTHKYRLLIDKEGVTSSTITIYTDDDSFVNLDYPCRACIYVKHFERNIMFETWSMRGGVYLGMW